MIVSHLAQEVENLRDEVLQQYQLAEASAAKVRTLEKEKEIAFLSFSHCLEDLEMQLNNKTVELAKALHEKQVLEKVQTLLKFAKIQSYRAHSLFITVSVTHAAII